MASAQAALGAGSWRLAQTAFRVAAEETQDPSAYEGLAQVAWWLDDAEACVGARETA
ncbi:MAG: helix-turn-helix transcriptional regulator, partial [Cellulomonadaceae bacterium]|nr:helix-turn-helix transcriptional regulator [Cellulomonadaceae bacterium]